MASEEDMKIDLVSAPEDSSTQKIWEDSKKDGPWKWYLRLEEVGEAKCKLCHSILKVNGTSTSSLHNHLKVHREVAEVKNFLTQKRKVVDSSGSSSNKITKYASEKESMDKIICRMAVLERTPFSRFGESKDIKAYFASLGYCVPMSGTQIREIILNYAETEKEKMSKTLRTFLDTGLKISLTMDEVTSKASGRRYANVNAHLHVIVPKDEVLVYNLGLCRCIGSMPADKCRTLLDKILLAFHLRETDIIGITTDAAPVMVAMGTIN